MFKLAITAKKHKLKTTYIPKQQLKSSPNPSKGGHDLAHTTSVHKNATPAFEILTGKTKQGIASTFGATLTSKKAERNQNDKTTKYFNAPLDCHLTLLLLDIRFST